MEEVVVTKTLGTMREGSCGYQDSLKSLNEGEAVVTKSYQEVDERGSYHHRETGNRMRDTLVLQLQAGWRCASKRSLIPYAKKRSKRYNGNKRISLGDVAESWGVEKQGGERWGASAEWG